MWADGLVYSCHQGKFGDAGLVLLSFGFGGVPACLQILSKPEAISDVVFHLLLCTLYGAFLKNTACSY